MKITIDTNELIFDIMNTSHEEVAGITDVEARYNVEAGRDKMESITRCLATGSSMLISLCHKIVVAPQFMSDAGNILGGLPESLVYELSLTERHLGKEQALADAFHAYLVEIALSKFYEKVGATDLSAKHAQAGATDALLIEKLIHEKRRPTL